MVDRHRISRESDRFADNPAIAALPETASGALILVSKHAASARQPGSETTQRGRETRASEGASLTARGRRGPRGRISQSEQGVGGHGATRGHSSGALVLWGAVNLAPSQRASKSVSRQASITGPNNPVNSGEGATSDGRGVHGAPRPGCPTSGGEVDFGVADLRRTWPVRRRDRLVKPVRQPLAVDRRLNGLTP